MAIKTDILRQISASSLAVGARLFVPAAFAAYTVDSDGVCRTMMGPTIQGEEWAVEKVDGLTVTARRLSDERVIVETMPRPDYRVTVVG